MEDNSGINNDGYKSIILKKTSSLFGLIGYFLGNQEDEKHKENKKGKDEKKLAKENEQIYGMLKAGISMMATKISSLNRGFGFLKSLSDLILSEDVIMSTGMSKGNQLSIENQENIDLMMNNFHQINQAYAQNLLYQFADSFQKNPDVLKVEDSLVNTLELEQNFDSLMKSSNHEIYTSKTGIFPEIVLQKEKDTILGVPSDHTIEPIELMQKVIESNLLLDEMLAERNSQYSKISPYELIPQESYYSNDDINDEKNSPKKGKHRSLRRRTLTCNNEPSFSITDKNIGSEKFIPDQNPLSPADKNIQHQQTRNEIDNHGNHKDFQPCENENFDIGLAIQHNSTACNSNTLDTKSNIENELPSDVATLQTQNLPLVTKNDFISAQLCERGETQSPTKLPSITYTTDTKNDSHSAQLCEHGETQSPTKLPSIYTTDTKNDELEENSIEFRIGSKILQLISDRSVNDPNDFKPTVLYIEKMIFCTDESTTSDGDNIRIQSDNFINLDDVFCLKFSKMTTDNKFNFFVWS